MLAIPLVDDARSQPIALASVIDVTPPTARSTTDFGTYLHRLMSDNGFEKAADLARAAKVPASSLSRWSDGSSMPTVEALRAVAPHLGVRLGDLMVVAGLATKAELGMVGAPPAPRAPLPPGVQKAMSRFLSPKYTQAAKATLDTAIARTVDLWEELLDVPREPQMRKRTAPNAKR